MDIWAAAQFSMQQVNLPLFAEQQRSLIYWLDLGKTMRKVLRSIAPTHLRCQAVQGAEEAC